MEIIQLSSDKNGAWIEMGIYQHTVCKTMDDGSKLCCEFIPMPTSTATLELAMKHVGVTKSEMDTAISYSRKRAR
jgi:hypothetical protein